MYVNSEELTNPRVPGDKREMQVNKRVILHPAYKKPFVRCDHKVDDGGIIEDGCWFDTRGPQRLLEVRYQHKYGVITAQLIAQPSPSGCHLLARVSQNNTLRR